jgi:hypothetical protein
MSQTGAMLRPASMTTADAIKPLLSRSLTDWSVSPADESTIIGLLTREPDINRVVADLSAGGLLRELVERVDEHATRPALMQILGGRTDMLTVARCAERWTTSRLRRS